MKQTRYRALVASERLRQHALDCMLGRMARSNPKSIQELEAQKKAIKEAAAAEVAAIRKATAEKVAALKGSERRLRALDIREQKRREFQRGRLQVQGATRRVLFRLARTT